MTATEPGPLSSHPAWLALKALAQGTGGRTLAELLRQDPGRGERLTAEACGVYLDYSKNLITDDILASLVDLADQCGLRQRIDAMFSGERINVSEGRAVLHVALRAPRGESIRVDGTDVVPGVHAVLERMATFADAVRSGSWRGQTGNPSGTSSTSASAARTWARPWPMKPCGPTATGARCSASSPTSPEPS